MFYILSFMKITIQLSADFVNRLQEMKERTFNEVEVRNVALSPALITKT